MLKELGDKVVYERGGSEQGCGRAVAGGGSSPPISIRTEERHGRSMGSVFDPCGEDAGSRGGKRIGKNGHCVEHSATGRPSGTIVSGSIRYAGRDLLKLPKSELRKIRGSDIAMIFQEPATSLNPVYTIGWREFAEALRLASQIAGEPDSGRDPEGIEGSPRQRSGAAAGSVPPRIVGRNETAGHDRHGVVVQSGVADRGRADGSCGRDDQARILDLLREIQETRQMSIL